MSITPVQGFSLAISEQSANASVRSDNSQATLPSVAAKEPASTVSGNLPEQESSVAKNVPSTYELPQDVVEVHQDPEIRGQIIIQYLDPSKAVVLQVPSNQELAVEHGIAQEFQQAAKLRESQSATATESTGAKTHGD